MYAEYVHWWKLRSDSMIFYFFIANEYECIVIILVDVDDDWLQIALVPWEHPEVPYGCTVQIIRNNPQFTCKCPSCDECGCVICQTDNSSNESFISCDETFETTQTPTFIQRCTLTNLKTIISSWQFWCNLFIIGIIVAILFLTTKNECGHEQNNHQNDLTTIRSTTSFEETTIQTKTSKSTETTTNWWNPIK